MKYELTKDLMTGNTLIDSEHKELFDAVNTLMDQCSQGKGRSALEPAINFLLDYVKRHFSHEEELQKKYSFPEMSSHVQFHKDYRSKLNDIVTAIPPKGPGISDVGALNMHIATLVSHIRISDKKLGAFLSDKQ